MKLISTGKHRSEFDVLVSTRGSQAAMMTLQPGGTSSDEPENEHPWAEQWLFVISGTGAARVGSRSAKLKANDLLLIERNEPHQIKNTGRSVLVTLNFYIPPAYSSKGDLRSSGRRS
jgi:mannose-6-phosphate isomerase-like protein (cupin superfamily)